MIVKNLKKSEHFNIEQTGMEHYDLMLLVPDKFKEKNLTYKISWMNPMSYVRRCAYDIFGVEYDYLFKSREDDKIQKYMDLMKSGAKFDMPILNYVKKSQEGLHRALAAIKLGDAFIPVMIIKEDQKGES